jgi:glutathione S-transferase
VAPRLKLYSVPASHPCAAAEVALRLKGLEYKRVDLPNMSQRLVVPLVARGRTVPALKVDGEPVVGSRPIMRRLDALVPDPPLLPSDPQRRSAVEEAERWGDEVLQRLARRVATLGASRDPIAALSLVPEDARLPVPAPLQRFFARPILKASTRMNKANEASVRADLQALPGHLDRIDAWVEEGVLGGETPNAADLQIGSSLRLLDRAADVRPLLAGRPCMRLVEFFPPASGELPVGTLPSGWVPSPVR